MMMAVLMVPMSILAFGLGFDGSCTIFEDGLAFVVIIRCEGGMAEVKPPPIMIYFDALSSGFQSTSNILLVPESPHI